MALVKPLVSVFAVFFSDKSQQPKGGLTKLKEINKNYFPKIYFFFYERT